MDLATLELRIARSENLPVLPQVVSQVLKIVDDPDVAPKDLQRVIERDTALMAKILRVANSAYYGHTGVNSIGRAITLLGMNAMRQVVMSVAFQQMVSGRTSCKHFSKADFWNHSIAVATGCKILATLRMPERADLMYVIGLIHDIGLLALDRFAPETLEKSIEAAMEAVVPIQEAEQRLYGWDHGDVGGLLADKWNLPPIMKNGIQFHHAPILDGDYYDCTCVIALANTMAHQAGCDHCVQGVPYEINEATAEAVGVPPEQYEAIRNVILSEVAKAQSAFQVAA